MKKEILLIISLSATIAIHAQKAKEVFISLPESILLDLNNNARLDLVDLYEAGREAVVLNSFNDSVSIEKLTDDYFYLKTGISSLQGIVLRMINESILYCLIQTTCAPVCDSRIEFYSVSWNQLNSDIFITPAPAAWFLDERGNFPALDIPLIQWVYDPETASLCQIYNTLQNLSKEDQAKIRHSVKNETKEYKWNGIRFE
jgi:hypothetical protein